jgi:sugar/nucleoside kinase (ribokinase family)
MTSQPQKDITFIGHISIDKVDTVNGSRTQPGGAALYSALAAKTLNVNPHLISALGRDFPFKQCLSSLDSSNIKILNMPSTRFHIQYNRRWEAKYLQAQIGAGTRINLSNVPSSMLQSQQLIHLLPMKPTKVAKIMERITAQAPNIKLSLATWIGYIKEPRHKKLLIKLASKADYFILNEYEAKELTRTENLTSALDLIKTPILIITIGSLGAIIRVHNNEPQMIPALHVPSIKTIDTTGAGDTWQGAFLASLIMTDDLIRSVTIASILASIKCSQWGFKAIQKLNFTRPFDVVSHVLALKDGWMQKRLIDFSY